MTATVFIALPAFGQTNNSQTTVSLLALVQQLTLRGIASSFVAWSFPDIVDLRNLFLTIWYDRHDASHLLMVDADMQFEPELVLDMLAADKLLVGCLYPKKRLPISWVGSALTPEQLPDANGLLELEGIGCGVMLIRRDAIEAMLNKGIAPIEYELGDTSMGDVIRQYGGNRVIQAFDRVKDGKRTLSEDFSFCWRHRAAGGKVYAVTRHVLTHIGMHQYAARYSDLYERKTPVSVRTQDQGQSVERQARSSSAA